jgi:hypothetical protein
MNFHKVSNPDVTTRLLPSRRLYELAIALMLLIAGMASAHAQMGGGIMGGGMAGGGMMGGGHGGRQRNQQKAPQQNPSPPSPAAIPQPWPRLDSGAVLCNSRDDLVRYQAQAVAGANGAATGPAPDCHVIQTRTAIKILDRDGPSRSHVAATDIYKETGWTNSYLPGSPPPGAAITNTAVR